MQHQQLQHLQTELVYRQLEVDTLRSALRTLLAKDAAR